MAFVSLLGLPAQAQTAIDLVSNRSQATNQNILVTIGGNNDAARGQKFTIPAGPSYILNTITIRITTLGTEGVKVTLRENGASMPGPVLYTMTLPDSVSTGFNTFTAPPGAMLEANTTYFVMVQRAQSAGTGSVVQGLTNNGQTGLAGWSISDLSHRRTNNILDTQSSSLRVEIRGWEDTGNTKLSALELKDGSTAITLAPTFASGTTTYTASVASDVDEITIVPTVHDSDATYEIQDGDGSALTDAATGTTGFQVDLTEGGTPSRSR